jgi:low affinity Fe/Cu permease
MELLFTAISNRVALAAGKPVTFLCCCAVIVVWAATGPLFGFSDTWQLIVNTGTTIVTFLMVFLIQNTQNRDGAALQAKLDELIRVSEGGNQFIGIEHLPDSEVEKFRKLCEEAARPHEAPTDKARTGKARTGKARTKSVAVGKPPLRKAEAGQG